MWQKSLQEEHSYQQAEPCWEGTKPQAYLKTETKHTTNKSQTTVFLLKTEERSSRPLSVSWYFFKSNFIPRRRLDTEGMKQMCKFEQTHRINKNCYFFTHSDNSILSFHVSSNMFFQLVSFPHITEHPTHTNSLITHRDTVEVGFPA